MRFAARAAARVARAIAPRAGSRAATMMLAGSERLGVPDRAGRMLVREAERRFATGDVAGSQQLLSALARRPPAAVPVAVALSAARTLRRVGEPERAAALAAAVLGRADLSDRQRAHARVQLAWAQERAGRLTEALPHLAEAVAARPDNQAWRQSLAGWHYRIGETEEKARHWPAAATAYQEAIALDGARAWWHYRLGQVLEKAGQWEPAAAAYEQAIARDGNHPGWHERLAQVAAKSPDWALAKASTQQPGGSQPAVPAAGVVAPPARRAVTGWIPAADGGGDATVRFKLNGTVIADTLASREVSFGDRRYLQFRRNLQDLWKYGGAGDVLEVEHAGAPLHIVDSGARFAFTAPQSRADELLARVAEGQIFNKYGRLRQSIQLDHDWQSMMFELFFQLRKELSESLGLELFPFYGTMLGAVREQNFIGHDNDFDTVYISGHSTPAAVRDEFRRVCDFLVDRGYSLRVKKTHTWVRVPGTGRELDATLSHKLDIFFAWFDEDGYFQTSYGHHGEAIQRSDDFFAFRTEQLGIREIPVPRNAEDILVQLYGPGWRQPDPGFTHFARTRVLHDEFQLGLGEANEPYWRQFYRENRVDGASSFAQFVADRLPATGTLLDIGCGTGRDAIYLARRGYTVVGLDRSAEAIERAQEACQQAGVAGVRFAQLDASSRPEVERCLSPDLLPATGSENVTVYLRFFLHSVDESTEDSLLAALVDVLAGGFRLCAEFRTTRDGSLPKVYGDHYRRYIDEQLFAAKLRQAWGFEIEHLAAGRGLSPYEGEDPHLARVIARTPGAGNSIQ
ncbi:MAG: methyltransferase domain-containing protein [Micromonosporaceae bacterium]|nr:methyltransferase domain-containing protein [Micromonosporaceae bacterium]